MGSCADYLWLYPVVSSLAATKVPDRLRGLPRNIVLEHLERFGLAPKSATPKRSSNGFHRAPPPTPQLKVRLERSFAGSPIDWNHCLFV